MNYDPNGCTRYMGEKEILQDALLTQKQVSGSCNTFAGECVSPQLRTAFLDILRDEHAIQADIFQDMQTRGWYPTETAEPQKIQQARQKFSQQP